MKMQSSKKKVAFETEKFPCLHISHLDVFNIVEIDISDICTERY